ncbi:hypothetical protein GCM10018980_16000 [Streptomyces capoamus]|uniref:Uncharacterized protein n=1 Tax=Streptomyces capoamus TaxID=68183 RepID=A0A919C182_9ACTN|nr:hypothetical protein GCM10010501_18530 [Streptomyces libani subsp. rufus]GHG41115.1 hypothetical protein GCM10018980_16000 [Streptomyces capoamus]
MQWEMEALEPAYFQRLVLAAVAPYVDRDVLARQVRAKSNGRPAGARSRCRAGWAAIAGEHPDHFVGPHRDGVDRAVIRRVGRSAS